MLGNPERLEAALDCLVENAVKFTNDGDSIGIEAHVHGDEAVLSVSDSGIGIPPEEVAGVFDTFRTGSAPRGRAGSGLGLAIMAATVEDKNGSVEVASVVGEGTRFTIRYPASPPGRRSDDVAFYDPPDTVQRASVKERSPHRAARMSAEALRVMMAGVDGMGSSALGRSWSLKRAGLPRVRREAAPVETAIDAHGLLEEPPQVHEPFTQ